MCLLAELEQDDIVLDPFAGYGSIPQECSNYFKIKSFIAVEKDNYVFDVLKAKVNSKNQIKGLNRDGLNLISVTKQSINKIITDPPWGIFGNQNIDMNVFYKKMLQEFSRILNYHGIAIILTAQKEIVEKLIKKSTEFKLLNLYNILVSGKKTAIYKLLKIN